MKRRMNTKPTAYDTAQVRTLLLGLYGKPSSPIPPLPKTPSTPILWATAMSSSSILLEWASEGQNTDLYEMYRRMDGEADFSPLFTVPVSVTSWMDIDLNANTQYCYKVRGLNEQRAGAWSNIACATTFLPDLCLVMTVTQLGVSQDFYTSASPAWTNCKTGGLAGGSVGNFTNAALSVTGDAWVITTGDRDANGLWHCADIFAAAPSFTLILSHNGWATLNGYAPPLDIVALGCGDDGVAYITGTGGGGAGNLRYAYGTSAMTLVTTLPQVSGKNQHSISSGASVRLGIGAGGVPVIGIEELVSGTHSTKLWWLGQQPDPRAVAVGFFKSFGSPGNIYSYADGGGSGTLVYTGSSNIGPVISDGTNCLSIRNADGYLMNGASALATPLAAFGVAGRSFSGIVLGPAGYGEIAVCAAGNHASNFISLRDTGGGWTIKDGDWVAVMGGNYAGGSAGTDAMILTC